MYGVGSGGIVSSSVLGPSEKKIERYSQATIGKVYTLLFPTAPLPSNNRQIQTILLHSQISGASSSLDETTLKNSLTSGKKPIPFGNITDLERSLGKTMTALSPGMTASLKGSIEDWTGIPVPIADRPGFVSRTEDKEEFAITEDALLRMQGGTRLSRSYSDAALVLDAGSALFVDKRFAAIDHADPCTKITQRVQTFLDFINTCPPSTKAAFIAMLEVSHSGCFAVADDDNLYATKYLSTCLYNDCSNLALLNSPANTSKSGKEFTTWMTEDPVHNRALSRIIAMDPRKPLTSMIDSSGFILKLKNDDSVKPQYRGKGLAQVLVAYKREGVDIERRRRFAAAGIKSGDVLKKMDLYIAKVKLEIPAADTSGLEEIKHALELKLAQGLSTVRSRNDARTAFTAEIAKLTPEVLDWENSSGDDELSIEIGDLKKVLSSKQAEIDRLQLHIEEETKKTAVVEVKLDLAIAAAEKTERENAYLRSLLASAGTPFAGGQMFHSRSVSTFGSPWASVGAVANGHDDLDAMTSVADIGNLERVGLTSKRRRSLRQGDESD